MKKYYSKLNNDMRKKLKFQKKLTNNQNSKDRKLKLNLIFNI